MTETANFDKNSTGKASLLSPRSKSNDISDDH